MSAFDGERASVFIRLLGEIGAGPDAEHVAPAPGRTACAVLAHLALADGRLLTIDSLAGAVWDDPPDSARNALQVAVSKLRKHYGPVLIHSSRAGYQLPIAGNRVDWVEAAHLTAQARTALDAGHLNAALDAAADAGALFAGAPLAGLAATAAADSARRRALDLRATARMTQAAALRYLGELSDAIDVLRVETLADPLGEPAHAALMDTLAAAGRPAEALALYDQLRHRLADDLGADPSPATRAVFATLLDPKHRRPDHHIVWRPPQ